MSAAGRLASAPVVEAARRALQGGDPAWIVGGAVRDAVLGREVNDLDLAATKLAANSIGEAVTHRP